MEKVRILFKDENSNRHASIECNGVDIHICAKGKRLMISEGELYDLITLFMGQFYEDFTDGEGRKDGHLHEGSTA